MQQHALPPPVDDAGPAFLAILTIMSALVIVAVAGLMVQQSRRAHPMHLLVLIAVAILALLGMAAISEAHADVFGIIIASYLAVLFLLASGAGAWTIITLRAEDRGPVPVYWTLGSLPGVVLLIFLALPPVTSHRVASRRAQCKNNLKALGLALHNWHDEHGRFPDVDCADGGQPPLSWRVAVLPFLDQSPLHAQYDPSQSWDAPGNLAVALRDPSWPSLSCPTVDGEFRQDDQSRYFTSYVLVTGPQTAFPQGRGLPLDQVTDGLANTMLAAEASGLNIVWTQPRYFDVATQPLGVNLPGDRPGHSPGLLSSPHTAGAHAAFGDGAVRFISEEIDPQVLKALTTATGGEELGDWDE